MFSDHVTVCRKSQWAHRYPLLKLLRQFSEVARYSFVRKTRYVAIYLDRRENGVWKRCHEFTVTSINPKNVRTDTTKDVQTSPERMLEPHWGMLKEASIMRKWNK